MADELIELKERDVRQKAKLREAAEALEEFVELGSLGKDPLRAAEEYALTHALIRDLRAEVYEMETELYRLRELCARAAHEIRRRAPFGEAALLSNDARTLVFDLDAAGRGAL